MKQKMIESEQEERRKVLEKEREKMKKDHERKEELKQLKDKEKLMNKIKALKDEEEKEKEMLDEHYKTKMTKKIVERADEDEELVLDEDEEQKMRRYRKREDGIDGSDESSVENDCSKAKSIEQCTRNTSRSNSREKVRKPYSRDQSWSPDSDSESRKGTFVGKTRLKKKVADGSDVEDGEVEEVDSDAEDEVDREEDQMQLLLKMKNLRNKISKMEDQKEEVEVSSKAISPPPGISGRGGRGRGPRGRGRGKGRGKVGSGSDEDEWSMKKYDFDAPDVKEAVESHKPNFVKAPRRVFEKHDGYYSEENDSDQKDEHEGDDMENEIPEGGKETEVLDNATVCSEDTGKENPHFKKVSRTEWNKMSSKEKKKYLKERRRWKLKNTIYIKDDSDKEQLSDNSESEGLEFSDSEDECDKDERLAKEALKSYASTFSKEQHPEDYKLVMRKDIVDAEMAENEDSTYETIEDIELRDKREKMESKEKEKKDKMREERLKRIIAFQASSGLREDVEENESQITAELSDNEDEMEEDEKIEEVEPSENPFYSSYKEALVNKENIDDPLKEEREMLRIKAQEDEDELNKLEQEVEFKASKSETSSLPTEQRNEYEKYSGVGILKSIIDSDKEKIQTEIEEEESKRRAESILEEERRKRSAEKILKKSKKRGDPNNPSKEEMDAAQELEQLTWQDRYMKNKRVKDVVSSSKMFSKVKNKLKLEKNDREQESSNNKQDDETVDEKLSNIDASKTLSTTSKLPGMIGSLEEYANLVGKSVGQLADSKYEPPEVESSDDSGGEQEDEEGDLWGAIMGDK